jgi:integrase
MLLDISKNVTDINIYNCLVYENRHLATTTTTTTATSTPTKITTTTKTRTRPKHKRDQSPQEYVINNFALDRKIKEAVSDLKPCTQYSMLAFSKEDKELIVDFIADFFKQTGSAMSPNTKKIYLDALYYLSNYVKLERNNGIYKPFREITQDDFYAEYEPYGYLRSLRKTFEEDPRENWVNTYKTRFDRYLAFWKFLNQPDVKREEREEPPQLKGNKRPKHKPVNKKRRTKEQLWGPEEHVVFLKYNEDKRLSCAHAMAVEIGCRPGELLDLKLGDIKVETVASTGKKRCRFMIGGGVGGKMKKDRPVTISDSIPFFNVWAHMHPASDWDWKSAKKAYLFPSNENKAKYKNKALAENSLRLMYVDVIEKQFPKLLDRPDIPDVDKIALRRLINERAHFPYIFRHEFSTIWAPKLSRMVFNQLLGHSTNSNIQDFYIHEMGDEGVMEFEITRGIRTREETISPAQIELQPKYCPFCNEVNKHSTKFCFKCNHTISLEGELENREKEAQAAKETESMKQQLEQLKTEVDISNKNWSRFIKYIKPRLKVGESVSLLWPDGGVDEEHRELTLERVDENDPFDTKKRLAKQLETMKKEGWGLDIVEKEEEAAKRKEKREKKELKTEESK